MAATQKKVVRAARTAKSTGLFNAREQKQLATSLTTINEYMPRIAKDRSVEHPEGFNEFNGQLRIMTKWIQKNLAHFGQQAANAAVNGASGARSGTRTRAAGGGGPGGGLQVASA